ncbi:MAG: hypothetical protein ABI422_06915 [Sphingomicrobium sp.]
MAASTHTIQTASVQTASISPLIALSALGSGASHAALCGAAAAAGAAASVQGAGQGCVLPAVDAAAPPPMVETAPPPPIIETPMATGGYGVSPILLALAGIAAAVGLYYLLKGHDNFDIVFPVSPA